MKPITGLKAPFAGVASQGKSLDGIVTTSQAPPPIDVRRWIRNGKHPNAHLESLKAEAANFAAMFRTKEVFRSAGGCAFVAASAGAGARSRWRFAFHSGPFTRYVYAYVVMAVPTSTSDAYARLVIDDGTSTVADEQFHYGVGPYDGGLEALRLVVKIIQVTPDTDLYGAFTDYDNARLQSACVHEVSSLSELNGGYLPQNFAVGSSIYDVTRQNCAEMINRLWKRGGSQVLNWTVDTSAVTTTSATAKNVLHSSYTANTPQSPGYWLDMTGKNRLSQTTGVPVKMVAYAVNGDSAANGAVYLKDSTGATVLSMVNAWAGFETGWHSTIGVLPASLGKYDILYSSSNGLGSGFSLSAVSIFEYES